MSARIRKGVTTTGNPISPTNASPSDPAKSATSRFEPSHVHGPESRWDHLTNVLRRHAPSPFSHHGALYDLLEIRRTDKGLMAVAVQAGSHRFGLNLREISLQGSVMIDGQDCELYHVDPEGQLFLRNQDTGQEHTLPLAEFVGKQIHFHKPPYPNSEGPWDVFSVNENSWDIGVQPAKANFDEQLFPLGEVLANQPLRVMIRGKEAHGHYSLHFDGVRLTATQTRKGRTSEGRPPHTLTLPVEPEEVRGDFPEVSIFGFHDPVAVPAAWLGYSERITGLKVIDSSPMEALARAHLGCRSPGSTPFTIRCDGENLQELVDFVSALVPGTPLLMSGWTFDDLEPAHGYPSPNQDLIEALCQHGQNTILHLTLSRLPTSAQDASGQLTLRGRLENAGIRIFESSGGVVVHRKVLATPETSFVWTGQVSGWAGTKTDFLAKLNDPQLSPLLFQYEYLCTHPEKVRWDEPAKREDPSRRKPLSSIEKQEQEKLEWSLPTRETLLRDMAALGLVINDPVLRIQNAAKAFNVLTRNATKSLDVHVADFMHADTMRVLMEKARQGVKVRLFIREDFGADCRALAIQGGIPIYEDGDDGQALEKFEKNSKTHSSQSMSVALLDKKVYSPHHNLVIADQGEKGQCAYAGTIFPWLHALTVVAPHQGYEMGLLFRGHDVSELDRQHWAMLRQMAEHNVRLPG